jgi:hypothetical protein
LVTPSARNTIPEGTPTALGALNGRDRSLYTYWRTGAGRIASSHASR